MPFGQSWARVHTGIMPMPVHIVVHTVAASALWRMFVKQHFAPGQSVVSSHWIRNTGPEQSPVTVDRHDCDVFWTQHDSEPALHVLVPHAIPGPDETAPSPPSDPEPSGVDPPSPLCTLPPHPKAKTRSQIARIRTSFRP
jgi:hypothetical protein